MRRTVKIALVNLALSKYPKLKGTTLWVIGIMGLALVATTGAVKAEDPANYLSPFSSIRSLKGSKPILPDVSDYIADADAARQLGKALFWDTQISSDGMACASCHFHAGADIRTKNQLNPGLEANNPLFQRQESGRQAGPNQQLDPDDFPFHKLKDATDRDSSVVLDTMAVFSSQGSFGGDFITAPFSSGSRRDCKLIYNPVASRDPMVGSPFHAGGAIYRKVEARKTPSTINAAFNMRQYWDGRANSQFNGIDPYGPRTYVQEITDPIDPNLKLGNPRADVTGIIVALSSQLAAAPRRLELRQPLIDNASLASQAVGPPYRDTEIGCAGKGFPDLARRLLDAKPLANQLVDLNDSLFATQPNLVNRAAVPGLNTTYRALIEKAFKDTYWIAPDKYVIDPVSKQPQVNTATGYFQIEHNFSLFWGLALQAYEQVLISDDTPFDRYMMGDRSALSDQAVRGLDVFNTKGRCAECHSGAPLSSAASTNGLALQPVKSMLMRDGYLAMYDVGFFNTGVRPTIEDIGMGAVDPYGFDLSFTRQYRWQLKFGADSSSAVDQFGVQQCTALGQTACLTVPDPQRDAVDGSFKTPQLRNIGLRPPYFHNGGTANLRGVIQFYNRGGDRRAASAGGDTTGLIQPTPLEETNATNLAQGIGEPQAAARKGLGLSDRESDDLLAFLLSLTDERVACHSGIFDHPELPLAIGQKSLVRANSVLARDIIATLPATGRLGLKAVTGACFPNSGDLFGSINTDDPRPLQATFRKLLKSGDVDFVVPLNK